MIKYTWGLPVENTNGAIHNLQAARTSLANSIGNIAGNINGGLSFLQGMLDTEEAKTKSANTQEVLNRYLNVNNPEQLRQLQASGLTDLGQLRAKYGDGLNEVAVNAALGDLYKGTLARSAIGDQLVQYTPEGQKDIRALSNAIGSGKTAEVLRLTKEGNLPIGLISKSGSTAYNMNQHALADKRYQDELNWRKQEYYDARQDKLNNYDVYKSKLDGKVIEEANNSKEAVVDNVSKALGKYGFNSMSEAEAALNSPLPNQKQLAQNFFSEPDVQNYMSRGGYSFTGSGSPQNQSTSQSGINYYTPIQGISNLKDIPQIPNKGFGLQGYSGNATPLNAAALTAQDGEIPYNNDTGDLLIAAKKVFPELPVPLNVQGTGNSVRRKAAEETIGKLTPNEIKRIRSELAGLKNEAYRNASLEFNKRYPTESKLNAGVSAADLYSPLQGNDSNIREEVVSALTLNNPQKAKQLLQEKLFKGQKFNSGDWFGKPFKEELADAVVQAYQTSGSPYVVDKAIKYTNHMLPDSHKGASFGNSIQQNKLLQAVQTLSADNAADSEAKTREYMGLRSDYEPNPSDLAAIITGRKAMQRVSSRARQEQAETNKLKDRADLAVMANFKARRAEQLKNSATFASGSFNAGGLTVNPDTIAKPIKLEGTAKESIIRLAKQGNKEAQKILKQYKIGY